jgi:DNA-binding transcriptional LysR family regulator
MTGNTPQLFRSADLHAERPQSFEVNFSCDDFLTLKQVVQRTDAIWQTSRAVVVEECRRGKIVEIRGPKHSFPYAANLAITSLAGRNLSPTASLVVQLIRNLFERVESSMTSKA